MINKVIKKLQAEKKIKPVSLDTSYASYRGAGARKNSGFHAKGSSTTGAARQRSIGNRNTKPSKKK